MLISDDLRKSLLNQLVAEKFNANLYLSICGYLRNKGLDNIAKLFLQQHEEETEHALQIFDLLTDLNADIEIYEIDGINVAFDSLSAIANEYLSREIETTTSLGEIRDLAIAENNYVVEEHLRKMIQQQQHEYAEATSFQDKANLIGGNWGMAMLWDASLGG